MSAKSGGCGRYPLPETGGDRILAAALITGVLHSGEVHPGQSSQRGVRPSDPPAPHHQRLPLHLHF
ncbi:hypothetical protein PAMP_010906 [Pampus punctatissimus]